MKQLVNTPKQQAPKSALGFSFDAYLKETRMDNFFSLSEELSRDYNAELFFSASGIEELKAQYDTLLKDYNSYFDSLIAAHGIKVASQMKKASLENQFTDAERATLNDKKAELAEVGHSYNAAVDENSKAAIAANIDKQKKQKRKNNRHVLARILTGGISGIFESKEQRKQTTGKLVKDVKNVAHGVAWFANQTVFFVPRQAFLGLLDLNFVGITRGMYPGILTEQEARDKGFDMENWKKSVKMMTKFKKTWKDVLGGKPEGLDNPIKKGFLHPPFRSKKKSAAAKKQADEMAAKAKANKNKNFSFVVNESNIPKHQPEHWFSVEGIWEAAAIAAGSAIIGVVADLIKKGGVKSNPYPAGKTPSDFQDGGDPSDAQLATPEQQKEAMRQLIQNDTSLTDEQKAEALAEVDNAVAYMNKVAKNPDAFLSGGNNDILIYGGITVVVAGVLYYIFKPKSN